MENSCFGLQLPRSTEVCAAILLFAASATPMHGQTFTTLASFDNRTSGSGSSGTLIQGKDGNLYGTNSQGGARGQGTAFAMTPPGTLTVLYSFGGGFTVPELPYGGLLQATDGNFYGTTLSGGANVLGTVFKLSPAGALTTLYSFGSSTTDGGQPSGPLIQATDGNFYGTTSTGAPGSAPGGTVFRITPAGVLTTLHAFGGKPDGFGPSPALVQATDGNLYGTTGGGGVLGYGTVFQITLAGTLTILHNFGTSTDGSEPSVGLVQAADGSLYGTTKTGGITGEGTVFRITTGGTLTTLNTFGGMSTNSSDPSMLVQATDGSFYGTTARGGTHGAGTVFKITPGGTLTTIYTFTGLADGSDPVVGLIQAADGRLYGTTPGGGANDYGTIFSLTLPAGPLPAPSILSGGIVPVDSSSPIIQPGEWVSIYGTNLASATATWNGNFPISLGNTSVTINGRAAYLWYVSPGQINLQAPDDTATGMVPVVVTTASGNATSTVTLEYFAPSFLLLDAKHVTGIILRSNGSGAYGGGTYDILGPRGTSLGYPTVAAKAGDSVVLFGTGFGPTSPVVLAGQAFSGAAGTTSQVSLLVNNVSVTPSYAGLSGAGLDQINLTVPAGLGTGDVPLVATVGGVQTPAGVVVSLQ